MCAAKGLSAHGFARHGGAGGECCGISQALIDQWSFECRLRCGAPGYPSVLIVVDIATGNGPRLGPPRDRGKVSERMIQWAVDAASRAANSTILTELS